VSEALLGIGRKTKGQACRFREWETIVKWAYSSLEKGMAWGKGFEERDNKNQGFGFERSDPDLRGVRSALLGNDGGKLYRDVPGSPLLERVLQPKEGKEERGC